MSTAVVQRVVLDDGSSSDEDEIPALLSDADSAASEDDAEPPPAPASRAGATGSSQAGPAVAATAVTNGTGSAAHALRSATAVVQQVSADDGDDSDSDGPPSLGAASESGDASDAPGLEPDSDDEPPGMVPSDEVSSSLVCGMHPPAYLHPHAAAVMRAARHASPPETAAAQRHSQLRPLCILP
jgi:hypothetical protein